MADSTILTSSQIDISSLKSTLFAQQQLLQNLYHELDAERESSATSASEALSVILRLQGEKAVIKMEAEQYKRLSEEKICHAEESFAIIEDIIYQKEMEVAALNYQVQAYRCKLLSMGCPEIGGSKFPENLLHRNENLIGRRNSAPILMKHKRGVDVNVSPDKDFIPTIIEEEISENFTPRGVDSYSQQIKKLDSRVKEITEGNYTNSTNELSCSPSVHDVFEVPQVDQNIIGSSESSTKDKKKIVYAKVEPDWLKKLLHSTQREDNLCKPSEIASMDSRVGVVHCGTSESGTRSNQINGTSEITVESTNREEELKLLNEIKEKLNLLHGEIKGRKMIESSVRDEPTLDPLAEAMLYFWM